MTSRASRSLLASPLANAVALDAIALLSLAALEAFPPTRAVLNDDITGRVPGLALVGVSWLTLRTATVISIGMRRVVAVTAGVITLVVGVLHGSGPDVRSLVELRAGAWAQAPVRELWCAALVSLAAAWTWRTSPAVRR